MFNEEVNQLIGELKKELKKVEERHIEFFKAREPLFKSEKHDRLHEHYMIISHGYDVEFNFVDEDLPEYIKKDCKQAFEAFKQNYFHK